jgi:hypothetical protein
LSDQGTEQRLMELLGYVAGVVRSKCKKRVTIMVRGDAFGVASVEELLDPHGPIPPPPVGAMARPTR